MRKHGGTASRRDKHGTPAGISPPGVARGRFVGGHQSGLAGSKQPPLFTRRPSSCSSQGRRRGEPWGASPRPSAPTYLLLNQQILHPLIPAWMSLQPEHQLMAGSRQSIRTPAHGRHGHWGIKSLSLPFL